MNMIPSIPVPRRRAVSDFLAYAIFLLGVIVIVAHVLAGCAGWGGKTCSIIDLAHDACPAVVQFIGEDGKVQTMTMTPADATKLGAQKKAEAARDAGVDGAK